MKHYLNLELLSINYWLNANILTLNALKSRVLILSTKTRQQTPNLKITIDSYEISVLNENYLDVYHNNKLAFGPHISYMQSKVSRSIGVISKIKYYVTNRVLFLLFCNISFPFNIRFDYLVQYLETYICKIGKLQNRVCLHSHFLSPFSLMAMNRG